MVVSHEVLVLGAASFERGHFHFCFFVRLARGIFQRLFKVANFSLPIFVRLRVLLLIHDVTFLRCFIGVGHNLFTRNLGFLYPHSCVAKKTVSC